MFLSSISRKSNLNTSHILRNALQKSDMSRLRYFSRAAKSNPLAFMRYELKRIPRYLKRESVNLVRVWTHQFECIVAQRLRRGQQMFTMYSKMWGEQAVRRLLHRTRLQLSRNGHNLLFSAMSAVWLFHWETEKIADDEMLKYSNEIDQIYNLRHLTVICEQCHKRTPIDCRLPGVEYCTCPTPTTHNAPTNEWSPFIERRDVIIWRKAEESSPGNYSYKMYGSYDDVTARDFLNVQIDCEYRKVWDDSVVELLVIDSDPASNSDLIYWESRWPRFFTNRDYIFKRRYIIDPDKKVIIIASQGLNQSPCMGTKHKSTVRVTNYWSYMVIKPYEDFDRPGIEFVLTYFDDPSARLPESVKQWVAHSSMPDFMVKMRLASTSYREYLQSNGKVGVVQDDNEAGSNEVILRDDDQEFLDMLEDTKSKTNTNGSGSIKCSRLARVQEDSLHKRETSENLNVNDDGISVDNKRETSEESEGNSRENSQQKKEDNEKEASGESEGNSGENSQKKKEVENETVLTSPSTFSNRDKSFWKYVPLYSYFFY